MRFMTITSSRWAGRIWLSVQAAIWDSKTRRRMGRRPTRIFAALLGALVFTMVAPATAQASHCGLVETLNNQGGYHWPSHPYAGTGYGPLARYSEVIGTSFGRVGCVGFYSPLTGDFVPESGWMTVDDNSGGFPGWNRYNSIAIGESHAYPTTAYATFHTPYGPARWVTQYSDSYDYIRWGVHNLLTNRVYLSHGWMPVVC